MNKMSHFCKDTGGSITALTAIALIALVGALAFVLDLGHLHVVQNELRNAADTCALRGARAFLPDNFTGMTATPADDWMQSNSKAQAVDTINKNKSDNIALKDLPIGEIQVGTWDFAARKLNPWQAISSYTYGTMIGPGISLPVKRDGSDNYGPVSMTLASLLGQDKVSVRANATAALSPWGGTIPGSPILPFGPWTTQLPAPGVPTVGTMKDDNTDNLGWTNLDPAGSHTNAEDIKRIFRDGALFDAVADSPVSIQNGVASSAIKAMTKSPTFGLENVGGNVYKPDAAHAGNIYAMPVFLDGSEGGDKFNHSSIVGAMPVMIIEVKDSPDNTIKYERVPGEFIIPGHGGGLWFGFLSPQPYLVE